ncbi:MAG: efflux RND transporter periplasmic adaptor subunit, partial [Planctomycetota bacterium]
INVDPEEPTPQKNPIIGGLIFEHCNEVLDLAILQPKIELVQNHAANALRNSVHHQGIFLYPLWNLLGKSKILAAPKVLPKTLLALLAIILVSLFLILYKVPFYVSADGVLVPEDRRWIFAGQPGEIENILVEDGSEVTQKTPLIKLKSSQLDVQIAETEGLIETIEKRRIAVENQRFRGSPDEDSSQTNEDAINVLEAELNGYQEKLELLHSLREKLVLKSPIDGQVITWDIENKLVGRTVSPEQKLLEVANTQGSWVLDLNVEDRRVIHLLKGKEIDPNLPIRVEYTLAAAPDVSYKGRIIQIGNSMQRSEDQQTVLQVRVAIDKEAPPFLQAKSEVQAKIFCGQKTSIGYLWLHDIPESFRRYVEFYFLR